MRTKYPILTTLSLIAVVLLLLPSSFPVAATTQSGNPVVVSSGSRVIGSVQVNGQTITIVDQWKVSAQRVLSANTVYVYYYYWNTLTYSGCGPLGTDWNTQEGIVEVQGGSGGPIVYYLNPADTYQGYTGLGCTVAFVQTGNTASAFSNYIHYYTTGYLCYVLFGRCMWTIQNYYMTSNDYNTGRMTVSDWWG